MLHLDRNDQLSHRFVVTATHARALAKTQLRRSWAGACLLVLRMLALLMVVELSGLAHLTLDAFELVGAVDHHQDQDDCEDEEAGHDCPPGCLNCHCAHAAALVVAGPRFEGSCRATRLESELVAFPGRALVHHGATDLESIYRPPRSLV